MAIGFFTERGYDLATSKNILLIEIDSWLGGMTLDVFDSTATGKARRYYCSEADQLRFINGKVANVTIELMCGLIPIDPNTDPIYGWLSHSSAECGKLQSEYVTFIRDSSILATTFKSQATAATTITELDTIFAAMQAA